MSTVLSPFHLAIPVDDLQAALGFYRDLLGCSLGRQSDQWIDFNFFGHQLVTHLAPGDVDKAAHNQVDGDSVPVRHFGIVLNWDIWAALAEKLQSADVPFIIAPKTRFEGKPGEQGTFFIRDPAGNALEFKTFRDMGRLFAT